MKTMLTVALGVLWSFGSGGQQPTPTKREDVTVKIVVASKSEHEAACKGKKYNPVDVLVIKGESKPWSCVGARFFVHDEKDKDHPRTVVTLYFGSKNQVRWESAVPFAVEGIHLETGKGPANPFLKYKFPSVASKVHESGPIVESAVNSTYKVAFLISGLKIDPDIDCRP